MNHRLVGILCLFAVGAWIQPASANVLTSVVVSGDCTSYTITANGAQLEDCGVVEYELTLTPAAGTAVVIADSLAVCPDDDGTFSATATRPWGPFGAQDFIILGESWLFLNGNEEAYRTVQFSGVAQLEPDPEWNGDRAFLVCEALPEGDGCTRTQGFWKNHAEDWPVSSITLGGVSYTRSQAIAILRTPPKKGDATYILAVQLIAAMLNVASGADANAISDTIAEANAWLAANALGSNPRNGSRAVGIELAATLDEYNNGRLGPDHCD